ncbi:hypothetical protein BU17DRAFT_58691 [Hysterangium stoloniferum]|nr:hypothetical protein BU17DRAFT_58691 [Hysterangium stoloniferum]
MLNHRTSFVQRQYPSSSRLFASSSRNTKTPNPLAFIGLTILAFLSFAFVVQHRATTAPASKQPKQQENPLVPPHRPSSHGTSQL